MIVKTVEYPHYTITIEEITGSRGNLIYHIIIREFDDYACLGTLKKIGVVVTKSERENTLVLQVLSYVLTQT